MNRELAQQWVYALRSGDYQQAQSYLTTVDSQGNKRHCCLGVLCELEVGRNVIGPGELKHSDANYLAYKGVATCFPPLAVVADFFGPQDPDIYQGEATSDSWYVNMPYDVETGLDNEPLLRKNSKQALWRLNDAYDFTFDQIADAIEYTYLQPELSED